MGENFESIKSFKEAQLSKAAMRYVGHPEHPLTASAAQGVEEVGAGLAPIRTKAANSHDISVDDTPHRPRDPNAMDADVSNPVTPPFGGTAQVPGDDPFIHTSDSYRWSSGRPSPPHGIPIRTPVGDPSPVISPSGLSTPDGHYSAGSSSTPQKPFQLPSDYADLVFQARKRQAINPFRTHPPAASEVRQARVSSEGSPRVSLGWDNGRPSQTSMDMLKDVAISTMRMSPSIAMMDFQDGGKQHLRPRSIHLPNKKGRVD